MTPLVSILIPAYNAERYLGQCIRSALAQTWKNIEIVVVDDGSKDGTVNVARTFESKNVMVLTQPNRGASAARNQAFAKCQGAFIQWLDADDMLHPNKITTQLTAEFATDPATIHGGPFVAFYRSPHGSRIKPNVLYKDYTSKEWLLAALATGSWVPPAVWLMPRQTQEQAGGWDERLSLNDDGEYVCRVVSHSQRVKFHPDALSYYRSGGSGTLSRARSKKAFDSLVLSVDLSIAQLMRLDAGEESRRAAVAFLQYIVDAFDLQDRQVWSQLSERALALGGELKPVEPHWIQKTLGRSAFVATRKTFLVARGVRHRAAERLRAWRKPDLPELN